MWRMKGMSRACRLLLEVRHGQPWSSAKAADDRLDQRLKELRVDGHDRNACADPVRRTARERESAPAGVIFRSNDPIEVADEHARKPEEARRRPAGQPERRQAAGS